MTARDSAARTYIVVAPVAAGLAPDAHRLGGASGLRQATIGRE